MLSGNLETVKEKIREAAARAGRNPDKITLVCVSKGIDMERIKEIVGLGVSDIGENRVQEARVKYDLLMPMQDAGCMIQEKIRWHMVGHLQRNKVTDAVKLFDLIHSVDSLKLALALNKEARKLEKVQKILLQVNISGESTKFGARPADILSLLKEILVLHNLKVEGLMTIAPIVDNPQKARTYFRMLRELRDKINERLFTINYQLSTLSMGMSDDYQVAVEEGADMVRIGRAIFNPSNQ